MKLSASILTLVVVACAAPTSEHKVLATRDDPPKQTIIHLFVCSDARFKGDCENLQVNPGQCNDVPEKWNDKISSGGPDKGTFCAAYPDPGCTGLAFPFTFPGIRNLDLYGFSGVISSFRCDFLAGFD